MSELHDHILVLDRDPAAREKLTNYLTRKGYLVEVAETISQANALCEELVPAIVFADVTNQEIDTLGFLHSGDTPIPIVIVSHVETAGDVVACLRAGASDFILKPIADFQNVDHVIHSILDKIRIAKLNKRLQHELEERNRKLATGIQALRLDQKAGLQVQMKMLPSSPKKLLGLSFEHSVKPSLYLSGDFLDYFRIDDQRVLFYFADVSGHGASSAFVTVLLKNLTMRLKRNFKRASSDEITCPNRFLKRVNQELIDSDLDKHITVFVGVLNVETLGLDYCIAGHLPLPIVKEAGGARYLEGRGVALGLFPEPDFEVYHTELQRDFSITVFSDGILEVIEAETLIDKEKLLLEVVSREPRDIECVLSSLGLDDVAELPDDIAVLSLGRVG